MFSTRPTVTKTYNRTSEDIFFIKAEMYTHRVPKPVAKRKYIKKTREEKLEILRKKLVKLLDSIPQLG